MKKIMKQSTAMAILNSISIILLIGTAVSFSINTLFHIKINQANEDRYNLTSYANLFMDGSANLTNQVRAYAATGDKTYYDNYWTEINTTRSRERGLEGMKEIGITADEQTLIDTMSSLSTGLESLENEAMVLAGEGNLTAAVQAVYGPEYTATAKNIEKMRNDFITALQQRSKENVEQINAMCNLINIIVGVVIGASIIIQIVSIIYSRKQVIAPIISIEKEMEEIAKGNLSSEFLMQANTSEIGILVDSIHKTRHTLKQYIGDISLKLSNMAQGNMDQEMELQYIRDFVPIQEALTTILNSLNKTLAEIDEASAQVSTGSSEVAQEAMELANGATKQASAVEELSATINDLSTRMDAVAASAESAKQLSDGSAGTLNLCNEKMRDLVKAMNDISSASSEIAKVIDTIEDIAFQTNILALNAAVEAARAGTAGKGFAVVADEVRNLANKSQDASKSTDELITRSLNAVQQGTKIVDETAETLKSVVDVAKQSSSHVDEIARISQEQAEALKQLTEGVEQIADVVQSNSATSEQSAAAAQVLNEQAVHMQEMMDNFRLRTSRVS